MNELKAVVGKPEFGGIENKQFYRAHSIAVEFALDFLHRNRLSSLGVCDKFER